MQGQQSALIAAAYFAHSISACSSFPFAFAALMHTSKATLGEYYND